MPNELTYFDPWTGWRPPDVTPPPYLVPDYWQWSAAGQRFVLRCHALPEPPVLTALPPPAYRPQAVLAVAESVREAVERVVRAGLAAVGATDDDPHSPVDGHLRDRLHALSLSFQDRAAAVLDRAYARHVGAAEEAIEARGAEIARLNDRLERVRAEVAHLKACVAHGKQTGG